MKAAIDIGSNSVRLACSDGTTASVITKLADGLERTGRLSPEGVERSLEAICGFVRQASDCSSVVAFATEAVRRAADGSDFIAAVKNKCGIDVKLLSGEDEARLALKGAVKPKGAVTVCDLGGGSMELISSRDGVTPEYMQSLPLGVVVMKNRYNGDYAALTADAPALVNFAHKPSYPLVAIGGSACTIAAAALNLTVYDKSAINGYYMTAKALDGLMSMLTSKNFSVFRPLCKKRADTVAYGAILLSALVNVLGLDGFYVSDSGNLDAILMQDR